MTNETNALILNVDDLDAPRYAKSRVLTHAGFRVIEATTGGAAIDLIERERPALVLLDVRLPDISGIEVCAQVKQRWPQTLVLQTSATFTTSGDRARGLEGGADAYLVQPIEAPELVAAVRALLRLHHAEHALRELNDELEHRVAQRTSQLEALNRQLLEEITQRESAEAALVQAQKMESLGQLTGGIAHDFNNLLTAVAGNLHLIKRRAKEADIVRLAESGLLAADRGARLTGRLLAFSRTQQLEVKPVDLHALIRNMVEWIGQSVGPQIEVETCLVEGNVVAMADPGQLELAILNLCINARDAMPDGGKLVIACEESTQSRDEGPMKAGHYLCISVSDTGHGMTSEVLASAFQPFFTTKPAGKGTGLGLAQVYGIARQSGGMATVDSTVDHGTTVSIWLPAAVASLRPVDVPSQPALEISSANERVLLIDDDDGVREAVGAVLIDLGYAVTMAADGASGIELLETVDPHVVVIDFAMPAMNGAEVARELRRRRPGQPILFLTGFADTDALHQGIDGRVRLLRKPFEPHALATLMEQFLRVDPETPSGH